MASTCGAAQPFPMTLIDGLGLEPMAVFPGRLLCPHRCRRPLPQLLHNQCILQQFSVVAVNCTTSEISREQTEAQTDQYRSSVRPTHIEKIKAVRVLNRIPTAEASEFSRVNPVPIIIQSGLNVESSSRCKYTQHRSWRHCACWPKWRRRSSLPRMDYRRTARWRRLRYRLAW